MGLTRRRTCPTPRRCRDAVSRWPRRAQPEVGQDSQRHLARPRGPQAADRSRRPARHRRVVRRQGGRGDATHGAGGGADPRCRAGHAPPVAGDAGSARHRHARPARLVNIDFQGRTAIVTGAAHGFGRAISLAFARAWCDRVGVRRDRGRVARDATACPGRGRRLHREGRGRARQGRRGPIRQRRVGGRGLRAHSCEQCRRSARSSRPAGRGGS